LHPDVDERRRADADVAVSLPMHIRRRRRRVARRYRSRARRRRRVADGSRSAVGDAVIARFSSGRDRGRSRHDFLRGTRSVATPASGLHPGVRGCWRCRRRRCRRAGLAFGASRLIKCKF
jgi:hypothetical protein